MNADAADLHGSDTPSAASSRNRLPILLGLLACAGVCLVFARVIWFSAPHIGATALVTELTTGATLSARVDTGAILCSIHCEDVEPASGETGAALRIGDRIRFRILDIDRKSHRIEAEVAEVFSIRTTSATTDRLCVYLPLRVNGVEATVLVTLNHRGAMKHPFLIGRNLLRDRFVVDVSVDNDDMPSSESE